MGNPYEVLGVQLTGESIGRSLDLVFWRVLSCPHVSKYVTINIRTYSLCMHCMNKWL